MRVRDKNNPDKILNAIQYYGEFAAGFDGEYSERPYWLDYVVKEYGDKITEYKNAIVQAKTTLATMGSSLSEEQKAELNANI